MSVTAFLIYGVGAYFMSIGVALSYSQLFNYALLATFILRSTVNLVELIRQLPSSIILSRRVNEVIRFQPSIHDDKKPVMDFSKRGILEFKNVDFRFAKSKENVLSGINFKINQGQVVGIIGSTGSGKSTLMNLIPRTFDVTSGQILVDGVDIRKIPNEILHSKISVVPQKTFLFSDTIKQNIAFGLNSNDPNDMVRIEEACKIACIAPFIEKLPNKYDSKISQNATNLSGGQKQRLAIARAIISHPEFLLFDDSFSALDLLTDRKINESLHANLKDSTIVIISQRISTILNADKIIVLEKGKVVGQGTHKELAAKCRVYQEIMQSQSVEEGGPHA
jgi:ATP-binding cassette subfamily B protein